MTQASFYQNAGWANTSWVLQEGSYPRLAWEGTGGAPIPEPGPLPLQGSGTVEEPYRVTTAQELASLSWYIMAVDAHFVLESDLTAKA
jgi:hypothetical protein